MSIPGDRKSLIRRYRGRLIGTAVGVAALFTTGSLLLFLVKRWIYKQQLKITTQHFIKEQIKRRFEQTQTDSLSTVYALLPVFGLVLDKNDLNIDELFAELKDRKVHKPVTKEYQDVEGKVVEKPKTKAELWNELKLKSITKLITIAYSISSLFLLTRLQLNILTRREYLESAIKLAVEKESVEQSQGGVFNWVSNVCQNYFPWSTDTTNKSDRNISDMSKSLANSRNTYCNEHAFLSLSWWLLNNGWLDFHNCVSDYVNEEFGTLNPRDDISMDEFRIKLSKIFQSVNEKLNSPTGTLSLQNILLPDSTLESFVIQQTMDAETIGILGEDSTLMKGLIGEAANCIRSSASSVVLETLINESFQYTMNELDKKISIKNKNKNNEANDSVQLAVIAVSAKDCCSEMLTMASNKTANKFLETLDSIPALDDLSASVYSNFNF